MKFPNDRMNKRIQMFRSTALILASFISFVLTYRHTVYQHTATVAYEQTASAIPIQPIKVEYTKRLAVSKTSSPRVDWSSYMDVVSATSAPTILNMIAQCESNNDPFAANPESSAKGLLQIVDGTWQQFECSGNVFNAEDNLRCGVKIITTSGIHHWEPSRSCWSKLIPAQEISKR